ncbi:MAG: DUF4175 family protein [Elusimicrobiota bacterium]
MRIKQFLRTYFNVFLETMMLLTALFVLLLLATAVFSPSKETVRLLLNSFFLFCLTWFIFGLQKIIRESPLGIKKINKDIEQDFPDIEDRLINTSSLYRSRDRYAGSTTADMIERLLDETILFMGRLSDNVLKLSGVFRRILLLLICFLGLILLINTDKGPMKNAYNTMLKSALEYSDTTLTVIPGDTWAAKDSDITVKAQIHPDSTPYIEINRLGNTYSEPMQMIKDGLYAYTIAGIKENTSYRVLADRRKTRTKWFNITLRVPPSADSVAVQYIYPSYTGLTKTTSTVRPLEAVRGTTVILDITSDKEIKNGRIRTDTSVSDMETLSANTARAQLVLEEQTFYQLLLEDEYGLVNTESPSYRIRVLNDEPPHVELTEPAGDITVSPEAKVYIAGRVSDAIGLKRIFIRYKLDISGKSDEIPVEEFDKPTDSRSFSYLWSIEQTEALPGSIITYTAGAEDTNTLYGPGTGFSGEMRIEIAGFREKHEKLFEKIKKFEDDIFSVLSESYDITSGLKEGRFRDAAELIKSADFGIDGLKETVRELLDIMETDPYSEEMTIEEYRGILNSFEHLKNNTVPKLRTETANAAPASVGLSKELTRQLERMLRLSEDAAKRERMNDILTSASDSLEKARELSDMLGDSAVHPRDIQKKIEKIAHMMDEMASQFRNSPHKLPDEFINAESVKNIDFKGAAGKMAQLQQALDSGDYDTAKSILDDLINAMQYMMAAFQDAAGESHSSRREKLLERTGELDKKLISFVQSQEELISDTETLSDIAGARMNKYEKARFDELKIMYETFKSTTGLRYRLRDVDDEFEKGYLYRTQELLEGLAAEQKSEWKKKKINVFLSELRHSPSQEELLSENDKKRLDELASRQNSLRSELYKLREGAVALTHMTALLDMEFIENLDSAAVYMGYAAAGLAGYQPRESIQLQRQALAYLVQSAAGLEQFSMKLNAIPEDLGAALSGTRFIYSESGQAGGSSGNRGRNDGKVKIPGPDQADGGKEFRRLILEALRQNHPEKYKKLIKEYFRSLSE